LGNTFSNSFSLVFFLQKDKNNGNNLRSVNNEGQFAADGGVVGGSQ
jgi:hypothetical protein